MDMLEHLISTKRLIKRIGNADGYEIDEVLDALHRRYQKLYPDQEVIFLSLPRKDRQERRRRIAFLQKEDSGLNGCFRGEFPGSVHLSMM